MSAMTNGIGWFEIGTDDPAGAERFYGELFGWSFGADEGGDLPYRIVETPAAGSIKGGIFGTGGKVPGYAVFCVVVADVADTCRRAEAAGGKIMVPATTADGGLSFAHLLDPAGNHSVSTARRPARTRDACGPASHGAGPRAVTAVMVGRQEV